MANDQGNAQFRIIDKFLKLHDLIGRSLAVTAQPDDLGRGINSNSKVDGNSGQRQVFHNDILFDELMNFPENGFQLLVCHYVKMGNFLSVPTSIAIVIVSYFSLSFIMSWFSPAYS